MKNNFTPFRRKNVTYLPACLLGLSLWLISALSLQAQTVYVTQDGAGQQTGADWANALPGSQLQATLASARSGAIFKLAAGLYKPSATGDRMVSFNIPAKVALLGGYAGSGPDPGSRVDFTIVGQPSSTTLSGDIDNDNTLDAENSNNVVMFYNVGSTVTQLDGVVITGGYATERKYARMAAAGGGGILNYGDYYNDNNGVSSPLIQNCLITFNYALPWGGGILNDGFMGRCTPVIRNCEFTRNTASQGGAICNFGERHQSSPTIARCRFLNNNAGDGAAIANMAVGHYSPFYNALSRVSPLIFNCVFTGNRASSTGGVMYTYASGIGNTGVTPELRNCTLSNNSAPKGGAFYNAGYPNEYGSGAPYQVLSGPYVYNCILWNNGGPTAIFNTPIYWMSADIFGKGIARLFNCLVESGVSSSEPTDPLVRVISSSPFRSEQSLEPGPCSPAVDAGTNSYYPYGTESGPTTDIAGNPRVYPSGGNIDIGAYEYQGSPAPPLAITQPPASESTVVAGATVETTVGLNAPADSYVWYKDGSLVTGQTSATLRLTNVQLAQAGSYSLVATSACNSVTSTAFSLSVTTPTTPSASLTHFWLINADTDQPIQELTAGAQLNLATLPTRNLNIQAVTEPTTVGSVAFSLSGQQSYQVVEGVAPYALFGDNQGDYLNWTPALGAYTLTATPYSAAGGTGTVGTALTVSFTVINQASSAQRLTHFWLINADTDQPIQELTAGAQLNLATLPTRNLNIQAVTEPTTVGSVAFSLSGQQSYQVVEGVAPYALFGDNQGDYQSWTPNLGSYSLTATPYAGASGTGAIGTALTVDFTVVSQPGSQQLTHLWLINADTDQPIRELTDGQEVDLSSLPTRNLNIQAVTDPTPVGSVVFELSGRQTRRQVETVAPYALFGDTQGDYQSWTPDLGSYTLVATPYSGAGGTDTAGLPRRVSFMVTNPGAARLAAGRVERPVETPWQVRVLGNPVTGPEVVVEVNGAQGQSLHYELLDGSGRLMQTQQVEEAGSLERQPMRLGSQGAGVLLLRVSTPTHSQTVKILKQ